MLELPGYKIIKEIGRGGMAKVYLARHEGLDRDVAIKVMFPNLAADSSYSERFIREARIVAKLSHHNIVTVFDVGIFEQYHYIAMEFLPGITLDDKIKSGISNSEILSIIKQISAGMYYAHDKGFIHRDIKPENIMFRENGSAVITDFGIARATKSETKMTAVGTVIGTAHYMSPEQAQGKELTPGSDIYSIGIMLYEMFTGKVPYDADSTIAIVFKHIDAPIPELEGDQKVYQPLLNKLMAKLPENRYLNCQEIIEDIEDIERGNNPSRATEVFSVSDLELDNEVESTTSDAKKPWAAIAGISTIVIAAAAGAYYYSTLEKQIPSNTQTSINKAANTTDQELQYQQQLEADRKRREQALIEATKQAILDEQKRARAAEAKRKEEEYRQQQLLARQEAEKKAAQQQQAEAKRQAELKRQAAARKQAEQKRLAEKRKREQQQKLARLLQQADSALLNKQYDKALSLYQSALKINHRSEHAKDGIQQIADAHLKLALIAAQKKDFQDADQHVQQSIDIAPTHPGLAKTQSDIFKLKSQHQQEQLEKELQRQQEAIANKNRTAEDNTTVEEAPQAPPPKPKRRSFGSF